MSHKITSKNLAYNESLPPFLAALRAQASGATGPDAILAGRRRPGKKRSESEEAEDAPLVVDEHGNAVDLEVDKDGVVKEPATSQAQDESIKDDEGGDGEADDRKVDNESKFAIGGRKRKVGKIVGDAADQEPLDEKLKNQKEEQKDAEPLANKKAKKKAKKIKLSFDEEEA